ncbi:MAG: acyl carrier protein [Thermoanaerobaculia bacterium]
MLEPVSQHDVFEDLKQIVSDILRVPLEQISADSKLTDLGLVESIKLLRIAGKIERRFGIELDDEVVFEKRSLGEFTGEIVRLLQLQGEAVG